MTPPPQLPAKTTIDPKTDACAIIVLTDPYMFRNTQVPVDIVRRIVIVDKTRVLMNKRIIISERSALSNSIKTISTPEDHAAEEMTFARMHEILTLRLQSRFCVFYDRDATLDAIRFALPRDRTVDLGQHVLLRNDTLREGGTCWCRSRAYMAPLEDLYHPILKRPVLDSALQRARGLLELFDRIVNSFYEIPLSWSRNPNWVPAGMWYANFDRTRELFESLQLEQEFGDIQPRIPRYAAGRLQHLNAPRHRAVPLRTRGNARPLPQPRGGD